MQQQSEHALTTSRPRPICMRLEVITFHIPVAPKSSIDSKGFSTGDIPLVAHQLGTSNSNTIPYFTGNVL
jgi:hypothetical protein